MKQIVIPEIVVPGKRLGRHVEHDPRSKAFRTPHASSPIVSAKWTRHCDPYDQGNLGSCTGNAMAGALMTGPLYKPGRNLTEADAVKLYSIATHEDGIPGDYPPVDTGSSGLAVAKAAMQKKWLKSYHHALGLQDALASLSHGPVIVGTNWYESMDNPVGAHAQLTIGGQVRGGHEYELLAIDVTSQMVLMCNSWGLAWGNNGYAVMSFATLGRLLDENGDCVVPLPG